jgi:uncharacterized protein
MAPRFSILSIDGGGLKGLIAIKLLRELELIIDRPVVTAFDLLAGTSTGGLISAALATPDALGRPKYDLEHVEDLYTQVGMQIFSKGGLSLTGGEAKQLGKLLDVTFGSIKLTDAIRPLFIPTFDTHGSRIIVFKSRSARADPSKNARLVDVCLATSAIAPVFPPHRLRYEGRIVDCEDAGFHLKNPAISALAELFKHRSAYGLPDLREEEVALVSVSTGSHRGAGPDYNVDIAAVIRKNGSDMKYVREQKLNIDFSRVRYLRLDLDLGFGGFSLNKLMEWMGRIRRLGDDATFRRYVKKVMC